MSVKLLKPLYYEPPKQRSTEDRHAQSAAKRGYGRRWEKYRLHYLGNHPFCVMHQAKGTLKVATVIDHIQPHKGDYKLMWDPKNHRALCKECHDKYGEK